MTATDPSLASTMVYVMITVNDKDDGAQITLGPLGEQRTHVRR